MKTFFLPDLGEGLPDGEINRWFVKEGDFVERDEPLVAIETAKAIVDVPSPITGKISKLHGKAGDIIPTGGALVDFDGESQAAASESQSSTVAGELVTGDQVITERPTAVSSRTANIKILPAVRALAQKLKVDLGSIVPTGAGGTITAEDVKQASEALSQSGPLEPLKGVRRAMALAMIQSHAQVVPVTICDDVDVTSWVAGPNKDLTTRILLAMSEACGAEPALNAWFDGQHLGRRLQSAVNIGLALDSTDGLFVPVIQNVQEKSAALLRKEIDQLKSDVQTRTISREKLQGATIVLSNFGKFAGRYADPIVVLPTVAILGVGALREVVLPINGAPAIRSVLPLSLTIDHRAVTGGEATRFLKTFMEALGRSEVNET